MKSIEERVRQAAWQIYEEIGLSEHLIDRISKIIEEKLRDQKAIDIDNACTILCHYACPHKIDPNRGWNPECDNCEMFKKMMEV